MEAVSRKFSVRDEQWIAEVRKFWQAFSLVFNLEPHNTSCGCHIHVAPTTRTYTLQELKTIAYAVVIYEKHVRAFMKPERRGKHYCRTNTTLSPNLISIFRPGRSRATYGQVANHIRNLQTKQALCAFMQGDERRVLWNFRNTAQDGIGTIEFRGGPQLHTSEETMRWILFAVGFVQLALDQVCNLLIQSNCRATR